VDDGEAAVDNGWERCSSLAADKHAETAKLGPC
jgi:hypothetical protein